MIEPEDFILTNARLVLSDHVLDQGWIVVADGMIRELGSGASPGRGYDMQGDLILPGLVELHTDNLESHYAPRPHVRWHAASSAAAYDALMAASGITTVFDSLRAGSDADSASIGKDLETLGEALDGLRKSGHLRVDHRTHLRCEVASPDVIEQVEIFASRFPIHLLSLMDHTPGQRQFRDLETWKRFYMRKSPLNDEQIAAFVAQRLELHALHADKHRRMLVKLARQNGIVLASHDDATRMHVAEAVAEGVAVAEFPTTLEAAAACHAAGVSVMMGGPNIVRGGSHSGNVAAQELAEDGYLDILSSDYVPGSLLMSAMELPRLVPSIDLPAAIRMVSLTPARAVGLNDRGEIAVGKRADLVRVHLTDDAPVVRRVWSAGRLAA